MPAYYPPPPLLQRALPFSMLANCARRIITLTHRHGFLNSWELTHLQLSTKHYSKLEPRGCRECGLKTHPITSCTDCTSSDEGSCAHGEGVRRGTAASEVCLGEATGTGKKTKSRTRQAIVFYCRHQLSAQTRAEQIFKIQNR